MRRNYKIKDVENALIKVCEHLNEDMLVDHLDLTPEDAKFVSDIEIKVLIFNDKKKEKIL